MTTKSCTITLLNKHFEIKCDESEEQLLLLAAKKLNDQMLQQRNKHKHLDQYQVLMMAALTISHELVKSKDDQEKQRHQVNEFISSLEDKINKVVGGEEKIQ